MGPATPCPLGLEGLMFPHASPAVSDADVSTIDNDCDSGESIDDVCFDDVDRASELEDGWCGMDPDDIWEEL
eukprot:279581-Lingulodinium_polyedra.AAC.1